MIGLERRDAWRRLGLAAVVFAVAAGCDTPSAHTFSRNFGLREDLPVDPPSDPSRFEDDCAEGGRLFKNYCGSCHNARPLGERPFANYQVAVAHMRNQAYLTGKEYRQIIMFLRRWDNVGPPTPPVGPSPKRFVFSQPISELKKETQPVVSAPPPPAGEGPFQPPAAAEPPEGGPSGARNVPPPRPASALPNPIERSGSIGPG
jgi:hypothetical protein